MSKDDRTLFHRIRGNAEWEAIKWAWPLGRSAMISLGWALLERIRSVHVDWIGIGILFALCMMLGYLVFPVRMTFRRRATYESPIFSPLQVEAFQLAKDILKYFADFEPIPPNAGPRNTQEEKDISISRRVRWRERFYSGFKLRFDERIRILGLRFAEHNIQSNFNGIRDIRDDEAKMKFYAATLIGMSHQLDGVRLQPQR